MTEPPRQGGERERDGSQITSDLAARIARAQATRPGMAAAQRVRRNEMTGVGRAFRLASEFVAAIIVGGGLGWGVDLLFNTSPWGLITLLLLGFCAGVLNVVRATAELNAAAAVPTGTPSAKDDDED